MTGPLGNQVLVRKGLLGNQVFVTVSYDDRTPSEGFRSVFLAKCFLEGCQGQTTTHVQEQKCFFGLAAFGPSAARPNNKSRLENVCFFGLGTPGFPKTTCPNKHFGIPLIVTVSCDDRTPSKAGFSKEGTFRKSGFCYCQL